jgi:hypothetical protein
LDWARVRPGPGLAIFLALAFVSGMKGYWYDFYLLDVALGALCLRLGPARAEAWAGGASARGDSAGALSENLRPGAFARALAWAVIAGGLAWGYAYKVLCDKQRLSVLAYERLERSGRIAPPQMTDATFGYLGWKLVGPFLALGIPYPDLAGFQGFVLRDQVVMDTETPWRRGFKRARPAGSEVLDSGRARIGYRDLRYRVLDLKGNPPVSLGGAPPLAFDRERFPPDPFPLDAREWDLYVGRLKARE